MDMIGLDNSGETVQPCLFCKGSGSGACDVDCPANQVLREWRAAYSGVFGGRSKPGRRRNIVTSTCGQGPVDE